MIKTSKEIYSRLDIEKIPEEDMKRYKKLAVDLLVDIHNICEDIGVEYILAFGTLLGAVRHKGFIPWDDDIDIQMKREDIPKFVKEMKKRFPDKYGFVDLKRRPLDCYMVEVLGTDVVEFDLDNEAFRRGAKIDIFPMDCVSDSYRAVSLKEAFSKIFNRCSALRENYLYPSKAIMELDDEDIQKYYRFRRRLGRICSIFPKEFYNVLYLRLCVTRKKTDNYYVECGRKRMPCTILTDRTLLDFEGHKLYGPKEYDWYLKEQYGPDYMELPPEDKREIHSYIKIDFGPYKEQ